MKFDYQELKGFFEKHKTKFMLAAAFVLVFFAGFGTGRYEKTPGRELKSFTNYSTKIAPKQTKEANAVVETPDTVTATDNQAAVLGTTTPGAQPCKIKGNISSGGRKIYHVPGGAFYKTVSPEMCFNSETEAIVAGFKKSGR